MNVRHSLIPVNRSADICETYRLGNFEREGEINLTGHKHQSLRGGETFVYGH